MEFRVGVPESIIATGATHGMRVREWESGGVRDVINPSLGGKEVGDVFVDDAV